MIFETVATLLMVLIGFQALQHQGSIHMHSKPAAERGKVVCLKMCRILNLALMPVTKGHWKIMGDLDLWSTGESRDVHSHQPSHAHTPTEQGRRHLLSPEGFRAMKSLSHQERE